MDAIYLWFNVINNALLRGSVHLPVYKKEERINLAFCHTRLYLAESDDERDDNYAAEKQIGIS